MSEWLCAECIDNGPYQDWSYSPFSPENQGRPYPTAREELQPAITIHDGRALCAGHFADRPPISDWSRERRRKNLKKSDNPIVKAFVAAWFLGAA